MRKEKKRCYLYRHLRVDNGQPFYVGIGSSPLDWKYPCFEYFRAHDTNGRSIRWNRIVEKAGGFEVEIILDNLELSEINEKEKEFIKLYGRSDKGTGLLCNLTDGGRATFDPVSKELRAKIAKSQTTTIQENIDKFLFPEPNTGCWLWSGFCDPTTGHIKIFYEKKSGPAKKVIYEYINKASIGDDYLISTCNNKYCVNPEHHNRTRTESGRAKLTEHQVRERKRLHKEDGLGPTLLGKKYGICRTTVAKILTGKSWGWING